MKGKVEVFILITYAIEADQPTFPSKGFEKKNLTVQL